MTRSDHPDALAMSPQARALFPKFLANREADIVRVRAALVRKDYEEISLLGHRMRGNGATYGLPEVSALGGIIEDAADARDDDGIRQGIDALEFSIAEVRRNHGNDDSADVGDAPLGDGGRNRFFPGV